MRTLREQADAALAKNSDAKRFTPDTRCPHCHTRERFIINTACCYCKKHGIQHTPAQLRKEREQAEFQKRLDNAVALYQSGSCLSVAAKAAHCSQESLRNELGRLNIDIRNKKPSNNELNQERMEEFVEARVPLMAGKLMDDFYRSTHAKC